MSVSKILFVVVKITRFWINVYILQSQTTRWHRVDLLFEKQEWRQFNYEQRVGSASGLEGLDRISLKKKSVHVRVVKLIYMLIFLILN
jgi:hypothetical protein